LHYGGHDLTKKPLIFRKELLKKILPPLPHLFFSDFFEEGRLLFNEADKLNLEGIIAKKENSQYLPGERSSDWLKIKTKKDRHKDLTPTQTVLIGKRPLKLVNLNKIFFPEEKITKGDLINYYREIATVILPHLKNRPQSLLRFPNGIDGESFFQKDTSNLNVEWMSRALYA
jgi:bifunctional non-homologous end joining protein LigD